MLDASIDQTATHTRHTAARSAYPSGHRATRFSMTVSGSAMSQRFNPGDELTIERMAEPAVGENLVVTLRDNRTSDPPRVVMGRLISRNRNEIVLKQFSLAKSITLSARKVRDFCAVVGCAFADRRSQGRIAA